MKNQAGTGSDNQNELTPAYLYILTRPEDGGLVHLTNWQKPLTVKNLPADLRTTDPTVFTPTQVKHSEIVLSSSFEGNPTQVSVGSNERLLRRYFLLAPTVKISCYIIRVSSPEVMKGGVIDYETHARILNSGIVGAVGFKDSVITATVTPEPFAGRLQIPRFHFSRTCNRVFGNASTGCPVNVESFSRTVEIFSTTRSQRIVTLDIPPPSGKADYFRGGYLRHIETGQIFGVNWCNSGGSGGRVRISLSTWSPILTTETLVKVYPGCRHTVEDCTRYGNAPNFGGFPFVPNRNPTMQGVSPTS